MSKLVKFANDTDLDEHKSRILFSLKDGDISIRKRALELLFAMCNSNNAESVVAELLEHIVVAEFDIKEEMVLKIAILAERFASTCALFRTEKRAPPRRSPQEAAISTCGPSGPKKSLPKRLNGKQ